MKSTFGSGADSAEQCELQPAVVNENSEQELVLAFSCPVLLPSLTGDFWSATFPTEVFVRSTKSIWQLASCLDVSCATCPSLIERRLLCEHVADRKSLVGFRSNTGHERVKNVISLGSARRCNMWRHFATCVMWFYSGFCFSLFTRRVFYCEIILELGLLYSRFSRLSTL